MRMWIGPFGEDEGRGWPGIYIAGEEFGHEKRSSEGISDWKVD